MPHPPSTTLDALRDELTAIQPRLAELHQRLTGHTLGDAAAEAELRLAWEQRDRIVHNLGMLVAERILAGDAISISAGDVASTSAAPPPAIARRRVAAAATSSVAATRHPDAAQIAAFLGELGTPDPLRQVGDLLDTFSRLRTATHQCDRWLDVAPRAQKHLVGAVVAWLREIQEVNDDFGRPLREPEIVDLISHLSQWSREHRPGWVNGLARGAEPDSSSWRQDAVYHIEALQGMAMPARAHSVDPLERLRHAMNTGSPSWHDELDAALDAGLSQSDPELVEMFMPCAELLDPNRHYALLECILERTDELGIPDNAYETMDFIPMGWGWFEHTRGRSALLLGGHPSADVASAIKEAFELGKVTWDPADSRRKDAILKRLATGTVDVVLLLSHAADRSLEGPVEEACAQTNTSYVVVHGGPTIRAVRAAIESELPGAADPQTSAHPSA